jgi:hypothetical protein
MTEGGSLKLRGSAPDGWLCAAHCGPPLAGGDGVTTIATTSGSVRKYNCTFLKHFTASVCAFAKFEKRGLHHVRGVRLATNSGFSARLLTVDDNNTIAAGASVEYPVRHSW